MLKRFDPVDAIARLDRIRLLTHLLSKARGDVSEQQVLADRINSELVTARQALEPLLKTTASD